MTVMKLQETTVNYRITSIVTEKLLNLSCEGKPFKQSYRYPVLETTESAVDTVEPIKRQSYLSLS